MPDVKLPSNPPAKVCPFCLSSSLAMIQTTYKGREMWVYCRKCGASGPPKESRADAYTLWNVRPRKE